jgi:hypothetical protein
MPAFTKPYGCLECGITDVEAFSSGRKTLCKKCMPLIKDIHSVVIKKCDCYVCGENRESRFYPGNKSRCRRCILAKNFANSPIKKKKTVKKKKRIVIVE